MCRRRLHRKTPGKSSLNQQTPPIVTLFIRRLCLIRDIRINLFDNWLLVASVKMCATRLKHHAGRDLHVLKSELQLFDVVYVYCGITLPILSERASALFRNFETNEEWVGE